MVASSLRHPITIGNNTYEVSPLDDDSHMALDEWVRSKYIERNVQLLAALPQADKELALKVAYSEAATVTWLSGFGARLMGTVEGVAQLLYEGVRKNHPDVTPKMLKKDLMRPENLAKANAAFKHLNDPDPPPNKKGAQKKKALVKALKSRSRKKKSTFSS